MHGGKSSDLDFRISEFRNFTMIQRPLLVPALEAASPPSLGPMTTKMDDLAADLVDLANQASNQIDA